MTGNALSGSANPVQDLFGGVGLLIRRTFFNEAPTVNPVQLSGQSQGLITGTIGAVDPEGDPISYALTQLPDQGTVALNSDGTYSYTPGTGFTGTDGFTVAATDVGFHINLLDLSRPASTEALVEVNQASVRVDPAFVTFTFIYGSGSAYFTPEARAALQAEAAVLASYIVVTTPVNVTYEVTGESTPDSDVLAYADSTFYYDTVFNDSVVQQKILTGIDQNGAAADGEITVNFANPWAFGSDVGPDEYDFESVALHELVHTLGFASRVSAPRVNYTKWRVFDSFIVTSSGVHVIASDGTWNSAYDANLTGGNGGLYFGGPNAVAAYGGLVPLYTPNPFLSGSSISHLDDSTFTGVNSQLMNAYVEPGPASRTLSPVELGILEDLGYTVTPQPQNYVLFFIGLAFVRRKKRD